MGKRARKAVAATESTESRKKPRRNTASTRDSYDQQVDAQIEQLNKSKKQRFAYQNDRDEVDQFHYQRDKIALSSDADNDNDRNGDNDEINEDTEVLDLPSYDDDNDDDDYDDDGDNDDETDYVAYQPVRVPGIDEDPDLVAINRAKQTEALLTQSWGSNKSLYYSADVSDIDIVTDDEDFKAEEEEAERLRKLQTEKLSEEDFSIEQMIAIAKQAKSATVTQTQTHNGANTTSASDFDLDDLNVSDLTSVELIEKDSTALTLHDKLQSIKKYNPELLPLIEQLKSDLAELARVRPIFLRLNEFHGEFRLFLHSKYTLLLLLINTQLFYLALKSHASSIDVRQHSIVGQIVRLRGEWAQLTGMNEVFESVIDEIAAGRLPSVHSLAELYSSEAALDDAAETVDDEDVEAADNEDAAASEPEVWNNEDDNGAMSDVSVDSEITFRQPAAARSSQSSKAIATRNNGKSSAAGLPTAADLFGAPAAARGKSIKLSQPAVDEDEVDDDDDSDGVDASDAAYYHTVKQQQLKKLAGKAQQHAAQQQQRQQQRVQRAAPLPLLDTDSKRVISRTIAKNEGLKPSRPRDRKTPKTRNRARYDKALTKRSSQVKVYKESVGSGYGGEQTGIKANVTKSVKFRA